MKEGLIFEEEGKSGSTSSTRVHTDHDESSWVVTRILSRHLALDEQRVSTSLVVYIICRLAISACINGLNLEASSSSESLLLPLSSLNPVGEQQFCFCTSAANERVVCLFVFFLFRISVFLVLASQDFAGS